MSSKIWLALTVTSAIIGCAVDTAPPALPGDVGDTSGAELKVACNLSRESILAGAAGDRRTAVERGFAWYDAQVSYSQQNSHEGYRTDCSGFVSMCWELGSSYTTANFINDTGEWTSLGSFDELAPADAMVYRTGSNGHIVMFVGWNDSAKTEACVLEQASTAEDMQFRARTVDSLAATGYHAIRATKLGAATGGGADNPQCYCDAECSQYGDCCSSCSSGSGGTGSGGTGSGGAGTGGTGSGGTGSQCYCDASCVDYGDCCANCSGNGSGGSGSGGSSGGSGSGGSGSGQCYCDASCAEYGDCCANCGGGDSGSGGSGSGSGGSGSGQCYCDELCDQYGDCCDYC